MSEAGSDANRWKERPVAAALVRVSVFAIPVIGTIAVAFSLSRVLPPSATTGGLLLSWIVFVGVSAVALLGLERLARRLMPLSALLRMGLMFPDKGPSRLQMAKEAGRVRDLRQKVAEARAKGIEDEPVRAAENILTLLAALASHDRGTRGHAERVRVLIDLLAEEMKVPPSDRERLRWAGILHDIGKLAVPVEVLTKPGRPDEDEWKVLQQHPLEGVRIVGPLQPWLGVWSRTIEDHHEKFDGTGYPRGLKGEEISLGGRIAAVADCYEAMTAARAYKPPFSVEVARRELAKGAGTHFDPAIVRAFLNVPVRRLWRTVGVFSWIASLPFLARPAMAAQRVGGPSVTGAAAMSMVMVFGFVVAPFAQGGRIPNPGAKNLATQPMGVVEAITIPPFVLPGDAEAAAPQEEAAVEEPSRPAPSHPRRSSRRERAPSSRVEVLGVQINRGDAEPPAPPPAPEPPPQPPVEQTPPAQPPALAALADEIISPAPAAPGTGFTPPSSIGGGGGGGGGGGSRPTPPPTASPPPPPPPPTPTPPPTYRNHGECVSQSAHAKDPPEGPPADGPASEANPSKSCSK